MGLLNRLLGRPLSRGEFAKWLTKRLRASGETGTVEYDPEKFQLYN